MTHCKYYFGILFCVYKRKKKSINKKNEQTSFHCSFCKLQDETINHLFVECNYSKNLWRDLKTYCQPSFSLLLLCPQSATFGFFDIDPHLSLLLNHILLLYKYYIYFSRDFAKLSLAALTRFIKVYVMEKRLPFRNEKNQKD